ncbi:hypothetical protein TNCV_3460651 [Trichonephila clavipes]|nr:hypothetical protein TNCV_3460651 [Trichonephila clavipes]
MVAECHAEWHARSPHPTMNKAREERQLVRLTRQNHATTSQTISQGMDMFAARPACMKEKANMMYRMLKLDTGVKQCRLFGRVRALRGVFRWPYTCLEAPRRPLSFDIGIGSLYLVLWFGHPSGIPQALL